MKYLLSALTAALIFANLGRAALAAPVCDANAAIDTAPFIDPPRIAAEMGVSGVTTLSIDLTAAGSLSGVRILTSSGNPILDEAALRSTKLTRFTPEIRNCQSVAGSYLYQIRFEASL